MNIYETLILIKCFTTNFLIFFTFFKLFLFFAGIHFHSFRFTANLGISYKRKIFISQISVFLSSRTGMEISLGTITAIMLEITTISHKLLSFLLYTFYQVPFLKYNIDFQTFKKIDKFLLKIRLTILTQSLHFYILNYRSHKTWMWFFTRGSGGIGRHARLRIWCFGVRVQVSPPAIWTTKKIYAEIAQW